jgi:hypothetical protein
MEGDWNERGLKVRISIAVDCNALVVMTWPFVLLFSHTLGSVDNQSKFSAEGPPRSWAERQGAERNAKRNLTHFGNGLGLGLAFDNNRTCILGIDDDFSLHLTFQPDAYKLYMYSPIIDGLPLARSDQLVLFERILEGNMLGGKMAGGCVGLSAEEGLMLLFLALEMDHAAEGTLTQVAPLFIDTVGKWRSEARLIAATTTPAIEDQAGRCSNLVEALLDSNKYDVLVRLVEQEVLHVPAEVVGQWAIDNGAFLFGKACGISAHHTPQYHNPYTQLTL